MKKSLWYGSKKIEFDLRFNHRKTLGITVTPKMEVIVTAPMKASMKKVNALVTKRAPWILKQQSFFLTFYPKQPPKRYISGETHLYLGRQYRLKIRKGRREEVKLHGRFVDVSCKNRGRVKALLKAWYLQHAELKFISLVDKWAEDFDVLAPNVAIRVMPKRWGSCTVNGKVILNPELIKAPTGCIEYVIVHELCHLVHRNHTQKFVQLQSKMMPDWERWKMRLERLLA